MEGRAAAQPLRPGKIWMTELGAELGRLEELEQTSRFCTDSQLFTSSLFQISVKATVVRFPFA